MANNISPLAHVDPSAKLGDNITIHPFAYIDKDVVIGDGCNISPFASLVRGTRLGRNNRVFQGAIIGAEPQDFRWKREGMLTYCYIGDNNIIREQVIINRGIAHEGGTRVGDNCFIFARAHIGHDSWIKGKDVLGNGVTIAGDCVVEPCAILSSNAVLHEGSHLGSWSLVKGGCRVAGNVPPFVIMAHNPVSYYGVNAYILRRKGYSDQEIEDIAKAYRNIYQSNISAFTALKRIEADIEPSRVRDEILGFIRDHKLNIVALPVDIED